MLKIVGTFLLDQLLNNSDCYGKQKQPTTKNILLLGMTRLQLDTNQWDINDIINNNTMKRIDKIYQRDLARIVRMEKDIKGLRCFSVSIQNGINAHKDLHLNCNMNSRSFHASIRQKFNNITFFQICLDYFWSPTSWQQDHWNVGLIDNIIHFATEKIIQRNNEMPNDSSNGSVVLPFTYHIVQLVLLRKDEIERHYNIKYLTTQNDMAFNLLWKSTITIDECAMVKYFDKELHQEEEYCKLSISQLSQGPVIEGLDRERVSRYIKSIPDLQHVRFVCLTLHTKETSEKNNN